MAARRKRRSATRNKKGRFVKRAKRRTRRTRTNGTVRRRRRVVRTNVAAPRRRRRVVRRNPVTVSVPAISNPPRRRRRRRAVRSNGVTRRRRRRAVRRNPIRRHKRRLRRNPGTSLTKRQKSARKGARTRKRNALARRGGGGKRAVRRRKRNRGPLKSVRRYRRRALTKTGRPRGRKRSLRRSVALAQYRRAASLRRVIRARGAKAGRKSPLAKAMHLKSNPGFAGLIVAAKTLVPQAGVAAGAMVGLAMGGAQVGARLTFLPASVQPYRAAIGTTLLTGGAYLLADKFAPRFKGAVAIGGLLGAVIQAMVAAKGSLSVGPTATKALAALGLGDYTTVGGRAYAESGMFRDIGGYGGVGDYTTVGSGADNGTEFAHDSLRGMDDNTEFAAGEGGVLSGGMFRGPSSR